MIVALQLTNNVSWSSIPNIRQLDRSRGCGALTPVSCANSPKSAHNHSNMAAKSARIIMQLIDYDNV